MKKSLLPSLFGFVLLLAAAGCAATPESSAPTLEARRALRLEQPEPRVRDTLGVDTTGAAATAPDARLSAQPKP